MCKISCVLQGDGLVYSDDMKDLSVNDMCWKYARILSYKVERTYTPWTQVQMILRWQSARIHDTQLLKTTSTVHCDSASVSVSDIDEFLQVL